MYGSISRKKKEQATQHTYTNTYDTQRNPIDAVWKNSKLRIANFNGLPFRSTGDVSLTTRFRARRVLTPVRGRDTTINQIRLLFTATLITLRKHQHFNETNRRECVTLNPQARVPREKQTVPRTLRWSLTITMENVGTEKYSKVKLVVKNIWSIYLIFFRDKRKEKNFRIIN